MNNIREKLRNTEALNGNKREIDKKCQIIKHAIMNAGTEILTLEERKQEKYMTEETIQLMW